MMRFFVTSAKILLLYSLLCTVTVAAAYAGCSPYIGRATINEVDVHNQSAQAGPYYVELKALDNSILSTTPPAWENWTLSICSQQGLLDSSPCRTGIPLSGGVQQGEWLVIDENIIQWDYLDLNSGNTHGMEIILYDDNTDVVDYFSIDDYTVTGSSGCVYPYDTSYTGGNNFNVQRQPDGVGDWDSSGSGASGTPTENDSNDPVPAGSPEISVADTTAAAGTVMVFTISLNSTSATDIEVEYNTQNGSALAGVDYLATAGTVTIPAGQTSALVAITTFPGGAAGSYFFLTLTDVTTDNATIGNNVAQGTILVLGSAVTHFRMDEPVNTWSGNSGEVLDSGGTSLHGRWNSSSGAANPVDPVPAIHDQHSSVIGGFCNAAAFDGQSVIEVPDSPLFDYTTELSATAWIYPTEYPSGGNLYSILSNDVNYEFHLNSSGRLFWWWQASTLTSAATIPLNQWTHVAITLDSSSGVRRQRIYINGVPDSNTNNWQGTLATNNCQVHIGGDVNTGDCSVINSRNFRGMIDEVKLYDSELTQNQVQIDMNLGRSCSGTFDHIRIEHDANASVCSPETVIIKACMDADCAALYPGAVTLNLSPSGWIDGSSFTFSGGLTTRELSVGTPGDVTLGTTSVTPTPFDSTRCFANGVENCTLNFALTSCDFDAVEPGEMPQTPIFTKLSGVPFDVDVLALDDPTTIDTRYRGNVDVDLVDASASACPSGPGLTATTNIRFRNRDDGRITVSFDYPNAASNVRVRMIVGSSLPACSSDNFAIRPQGLGVSSPDANNTALTGLPAVVSGDTFSLTASTLAGYDGTPAINAALVSGTPNAGLLSGDFPAANAATGVSAGTSFRYSEVGHFGLGQYAVYDSTFTQVDSVKNECVSGFSNSLSGGMYGCSFGSPAIPISIGSSGFGRFVPARFNVSANGPIFADGCSAFSYLGQDFGYLIDPQLTVTALNRSGNTALNYGANYWRLNSTFGGRSYVNNVATAATLSIANLGTASWSGTGDSDGIGIADISGEELNYSKPSVPEGPFAADVDLIFSAVDLTDADGACYDPEDDGICNSYSISSIGGTELRYGRMLLENAYGPETLPLTIPVRTEYYDGGNFITNTLDSCSPYDFANLLLGPYQGNLDSGETTASGGGTLAGGLGNNLLLSAPGVGNDGSVQLEYDLSTGGLPWLQYDWDGDGSVDNPTATGTFGIFKGNERLIYMRESVW